MRYMMSIMSDPQAEADTEMTPEIFQAMADYNEELVKAGVLLAGEGLAPSGEATRVTFSDGRTSVTDGPFAEAKEFIAGYWILQVSSHEEAVEWARRCPHGGAGETSLVLRRIMGADDFGDEMPEELKERERQMRAHNEHEA
ncbi:YciI family protein [Nocardiopsis sp. NPDC101807]|uniref:YciI family protein n=1 Tax=Nocardiopsis sp. NPDC101807 TaxID=3364339 RepID=UPI0037FE42AA